MLGSFGAYMLGHETNMLGMLGLWLRHRLTPCGSQIYMKLETLVS